MRINRALAFHRQQHLGVVGNSAFKPTANENIVMERKRRGFIQAARTRTSLQHEPLRQYLKPCKRVPMIDYIFNLLNLFFKVTHA
jgi:hypothetical protein